MIIPRHKICDFCEQPVGVNKRYFKIKSKNYLVGYGGGWSDNRTYHMCEDCMQEFAIHLQSKFLIIKDVVPDFKKVKPVEKRGKGERNDL